MIEKLFSGETLSLLKKALDAASLRHQVISDNIANVNTPGFKRSEVVFQQELKEALTKNPDSLHLAVTNPGHISVPVDKEINEVQPRIILQNDTVMRNDLNNVDIEAEMVKLKENTLLYSALAQITSLKLSALKSAINGQ